LLLLLLLPLLPFRDVQDCSKQPAADGVSNCFHFTAWTQICRLFPLLLLLLLLPIRDVQDFSKQPAADGVSNCFHLTGAGGGRVCIIHTALTSSLVNSTEVSLL
jgi:hypothetical protein